MQAWRTLTADMLNMTERLGMEIDAKLIKQSPADSTKTKKWNAKHLSCLGQAWNYSVICRFFWREKTDNYNVDEFSNYEISHSRPRLKLQANATLCWGQGVETSTYLIDTEILQVAALLQTANNTAWVSTSNEFFDEQLSSTAVFQTAAAQFYGVTVNPTDYKQNVA